MENFKGGGGCDTGGGGGGYSGGDIMNSTNGEGGTSFLGLTRSIRELSFIYPGSNSGHGSVILIPAIEGCGNINFSANVFANLDNFIHLQVVIIVVLHSMNTGVL